MLEKLLLYPLFLALLVAGLLVYAGIGLAYLIALAIRPLWPARRPCKSEPRDVP